MRIKTIEDWLQSINLNNDCIKNALILLNRTEHNFIENKLRPHPGGVRAYYTNKQTKACNNEKEAEASHHHAYAKQSDFMALKMMNFRWKMMMFLPPHPKLRLQVPSEPLI